MKELKEMRNVNEGMKKCTPLMWGVASFTHFFIFISFIPHFSFLI